MERGEGSIEYGEKTKAVRDAVLRYIFDATDYFNFYVSGDTQTGEGISDIIVFGEEIGILPRMIEIYLEHFFDS